MAQVDRIKIEPEWKALLKYEFAMPYMVELRAFLKEQLSKKKIIYPKPSEIFNAFKHTPYSKVKVVILGQDPYHGPGQAHGLCFSVRKGVKPPPSLQNIFKEIETDVKISRPTNGELTYWADQGVLLLNTVLTVENAKAGSHHGKGWERFTDRVIQTLNHSEKPLIFVLWGSPAQKKAELITNKKHVILKSPHPSPLSAHRGFLGNKHFSKINSCLVKWGEKPIDWATNY
ncbi:MAG: uracil-DNA glycosylase [Oligoflexia bacterium]|nr:uracil-DNA glycosylase [Oligoflexia bacterium]